MKEKTATHGITTKEKFAYACGDFGGVLTFSLISSYLTMFYTDCLHIPLFQITILMLVARIWDAVNDPMWGGFVDSRKPTKYGRFRPYVIGASIPLAIAAFLMFTKIPGLSPAQYLIYAYVTYILYGMMYTGVNIPYGSLASAMTDDPQERSSLSVWRSIGAGFGNIPSMIILPLVVYSSYVDQATGKTEKYLDSTKLSIAVACIAVLSVFIYFFHFKNTKERITISEEQRKSEDGKMHVFRTVKALLKNRPFIFLCLSSMLLIAFQMYTQTTYNYLFKNYYEKPGLYAFVTIATYLPMAMFLPFIGKLVKKFGKKELCAFGLGFAAVVNFVMYFIGLTPAAKNPYIFMVLLLLSGAGQTFFTLEVWALVMDVIDYHEYRTGRREEGTTYSLYSFTRKLGQTLAGVGVPLLLAAIGYNVNSRAQTAAVTNHLYTMATLVPAIVLLLMFLLLTFGYTLSKERLPKMYEELRERREKEE